MMDTTSRIIMNATTTTNPFKVGGRVRVVHSERSGLDAGTEHTVVGLNGSDIRVDAISWSLAHTRFEPVESEPETPDFNEFLSTKAKELALAIDNGTMAGYYSALGFLVQTLQELSAYTQE